LKTFWKALNHRINGLSLRERRLIALTSSCVVIAFYIMSIWLPLWNSIQLSMHENTKIEIDIETSKKNIAILEERSKVDVNLPYREKLIALKEQASEQQEKINNITNALIQPEKMNMVFQGLLEKSKLQFESIKNGLPKSIELNQDKNSNQVLYEHSLLLEMKGQYIHGLEYIQSIEKQDWQLYWDEIEFKTLRYPQGLLTLKVHTLSTSDKVLGL
jgi:hypothetical protein